jgi:hypothetical protein
MRWAAFVNKRPRLTPSSLCRSIAWLADRRRNPTPINSDGWSNGKAAAVLYARHGARVFAIDIQNEAAHETERLIEAEGGICRMAQADVTKSSEVERTVSDIVKLWGRIDVLHNNVGITEMGVNRLGVSTPIGEPSY